MDVTQKGGADSFSSFWEELQYYWRKLPDRALYLGLTAAWVLLFQFVGWTSNTRNLSNSLFAWMWDKWSNVANDAAHGKIIPFVVLGLLWYSRKRLVAAAKGAWWPALVGVAFALVLHVAGFMVQQPRFSMVALFSGAWMLIGVIWGREAMKVCFFPFFIFGFCVPMGGTFAQGLTLPLRLLAAKSAFFVTHDCLDVSVQRTGTKLFDPAGVFGNFDVAAECSGIRSFTALLAITTIFSVVTMKSWWRRAVLILSTIPLALVCNIVRVTTIIMAANACRTPAAGQAVDNYFGYVTYAMALGGLMLLGKLLREKPTLAPP